MKGLTSPLSAISIIFRNIASSFVTRMSWPSLRMEIFSMKVTKLEAMFLKMMEMALKGEVKPFMTLFGLAQQYGEFEPESTSLVKIKFVNADPAKFKHLLPELDREK